MHYKGLGWVTRSTDPHHGSRKTDKLQEKSWRAKLEDSVRVAAKLSSLGGLPCRKRHVFICLCWTTKHCVHSSSLRRILLMFSLDSWVRLLKWDRTETSSPNLSPIFLQVSSWGRVLQSTVLMKFISSFFFRNIGFFYQSQWVFILYPNYIMILWEDDD